MTKNIIQRYRDGGVRIVFICFVPQGLAMYRAFL